MEFKNIKSILLFLFTFVLCVSYSNAITTDNLTSYYTMNNTYVDAHGSNDLTCSNCPTYTASGIIGGGYTMDGTNDYFDTGITYGKKGTINFWIDPVNAAGTEQKTFLAADAGTHNIVFQNWNDGNTYWGIKVSGTQYRVTENDAFPSGLFMVTFTWDDSTGNYTLYWNGVKKGSNNNLPTITTHAYPMFIGAYNYQGSASSFSAATWDEVSFWDEALSVTEVEELYNSGSGLAYPFSSTPALSVNILNITANGVTFVNDTEFSVNDITFNVTYEVNNSDIGNFTNSSITTLTDLANGVYYQQFEVCYNTTCDTSINYTYTVNVTDIPEIQIISQKINGIELTDPFNYNFNTGNLTLTTSVLNVSTNSNIDHYYTLTLLPITPISAGYFAYNSLTGNKSFNLSDAGYRLNIIYSNNETTAGNIFYFFEVDTTVPIINHNIPSEINTYNWTGVEINASDTNLDTCLFEIEGTNYTCSTFTNYNFTTNGNKDWSIFVNDSAGNSVTETGTLLVNPPFYVYFNLTNGTQITNFKVNGTDYINYFEGNIYDYGLGTHNFTFSKDGLETKTFELTFTNTSNINTSVTIGLVYINVNIYYRTNSSVFDQLAEVRILDLLNSTTSNGTISFQNLSFSTGTYTMQVLSDGYYTEQKTFTYDGETNATLSFYLLLENGSTSSTLYINTQDELYNIIPNVDTRLLEYDETTLSFKEVSQCYTNSNGRCKFSKRWWKKKIF